MALLSSNFQFKFTLQNTLDSIQWFKRHIKELSGSNVLKNAEQKLTGNSKQDSIGIPTDTFERGKMYLFHYDPKTRDSLDYYDTFPLILLTSIEKNTFTGLNLHYLPVEPRMILLSNLTQKTVVKNTGEMDRLNIRYDNLKNVQEFQFFQPCFKRYLKSNIKSVIKLIPPEDWGFAAALPIETFKKQTKQYVWSESMKSLDMTL
jgi:hypothetical protein